MFKLKIKKSGQTCLTTKFFNTLQEVADHIKTICNANTLEEVLTHQKEFNIRFYLSYNKNN